ncbi:unnamed protein product [Prorocentrum cordatum]|uniref:Uncharacterized protein n=1 Tax=Prorocentrum cordatum TaxID=2364126 RepID=A0ABN9UBR3_9DINO|nr:unnamed protein product [Polarella glacialis]
MMDDAGTCGRDENEVSPEVELDEESFSDQRLDDLAHGGLRRSQAQLIIPRTISEYFECCRYSRCHSEGLLLAASQPTGELVHARRLVPRALSEGLLAGRLIMMASSMRRGGAEGDADCVSRGSAEPAAPPPRFPAEDLEQDMLLEGRIVRIANIGLYIDVGATLLGLLRCLLLPRRRLQRACGLRRSCRTWSSSRLPTRGTSASACRRLGRTTKPSRTSPTWTACAASARGRGCRCPPTASRLPRAGATPTKVEGDDLDNAAWWILRPTMIGGSPAPWRYVRNIYFGSVLISMTLGQHDAIEHDRWQSSSLTVLCVDSQCMPSSLRPFDRNRSIVCDLSFCPEGTDGASDACSFTAY